MARVRQSTPRPDPKQNRLLARIEPGDYDAIIKASKVISVKLRVRLHRQDQRVDVVYFPITCMVSLLVTASDKPQMEMATVGREGVGGASELLLYPQGAMGLNLVQIPGAVLRVDADVFRKLVDSRPLMRRVIDRHLYALMRQILFGAACNRLHSMEQRCARWLLMTHDRAGSDTFPLTQEFLSHMLGVRRASVNLATGRLKKAGYIRYVRGTITMIDRPGLESAACGCYGAISAVYDSLLSGTSD
ncbi:MAG: Crp/Fnr family transcriptional regulator [Acidobacteriota bacterium]|nr:Crp/Fnr family transcriptional regulator [Acidobacteriota bacterium]